ncbi:hypothetical protein B5807_07386 [Epicoccum nigrum]|uniref:Uncharacterized protein n=1 Tax=Epicoccum nigrum TaxID=105696 RepID=A0A1Y2LU02_EPING|nr:hypothetical protein B5807_07386 [Epicoccum nigrum]
MSISSLSSTQLKRRITSLLPTEIFSTKGVPRYRYTPLGENQIRLIKLHPGEPGSPLQCTLKIVDLGAYSDINTDSDIKDWVRFYAISYCWGTDKKKAMVPLHISLRTWPTRLRGSVALRIQSSCGQML